MYTWLSFSSLLGDSNFDIFLVYAGAVMVEAKCIEVERSSISLFVKSKPCTFTNTVSRGGSRYCPRLLSAF